MHTGDKPDAPDGRLSDLLHAGVFSISSAAGSLISGVQQCAGIGRASEGSVVGTGGSIGCESPDFGPYVLLSNADIAKSVAPLVGGPSVAGAKSSYTVEERKREPAKKEAGPGKTECSKTGKRSISKAQDAIDSKPTAKSKCGADRLRDSDDEASTIDE